jgi:hypothetical protein
MQFKNQLTLQNIILKENLFLSDVFFSFLLVSNLSNKKLNFPLTKNYISEEKVVKLCAKTFAHRCAKQLLFCMANTFLLPHVCVPMYKGKMWTKEAENQRRITTILALRNLAV